MVEFLFSFHKDKLIRYINEHRSREEYLFTFLLFYFFIIFLIFFVFFFISFLTKNKNSKIKEIYLFIYPNNSFLYFDCFKNDNDNYFKGILFVLPFFIFILKSNIYFYV